MKKIKWQSSTLIVALIFYSNIAFAYMDPATQASSRMADILFGAFGTSLSAILIGATFLMAYVGKITWDRFVFVGFCAAGFLGSKSIVSIISGWVS